MAPVMKGDGMNDRHHCRCNGSRLSGIENDILGALRALEIDRGRSTAANIATRIGTDMDTIRSAIAQLWAAGILMPFHPHHDSDDMDRFWQDARWWRRAPAFRVTEGTQKGKQS